MKNGSHIDQTQSAIVLENLINKLFASFANKSGDNQSSQGDAPKADSPKPAAAPKK